jgi:beta-phosphoglucomutase-like phosphatase (HAD superfamily)
VGVRAKVHTRPARTFWWDREPAVESDVLRAVIFDADSALAEDGCDTPRPGLIDSVMSLFCSGIWVGVVSTRRREWVETLVRHTVGDGLVETIVTVDDLADLADLPTARSREAELYRLALWEMGITPRDALAVTGSRRGLRSATAAGLPALEIRAGYDAPKPLLTAGFQRVHRRWRMDRLAA